MALLWIGSAWGSSATVADWSGGGEVDGTWTLTDGSAELSLGTADTLRVDARLRLADGQAFTLTAGEVELRADYGGGGGLSFAGSIRPFPGDELTWTVDAAPLLTPELDWEGAALGAPELVVRDGAWLVYYAAEGGIGHARSEDGVSWTRLADPVLDGTSPTAVVDGDRVVLVYGCGGALCRATSTDGADFVDEGEVVDAGEEPSLALDPEGTWHLWYRGEDGARAWATSPDGVDWSEAGVVDDRLDGLDAWAGDYGFEGLYSVGDGIGWALGGDDATFASAAADRVPLVDAGAAGWSGDGVGEPAGAVDGVTPHLLYAALDGGAGVVGHAVATPTPGAWVDLTLTWDGATATLGWNDAPAVTATLSAVERLVLGAEGTVEVHRLDVEWTSAGGSGDTGDSGDTGGSAADTGDTAAVTDSAADSGADNGDFLPAAAAFGEPGGFGCAHAPPAAGAALPALLAALRRRRMR